MEEAIRYFKENGVRCKKIEDGNQPFIAVFGYGRLTRKEIVRVIERNGLLCMFFEGAIREDEYARKHENGKGRSFSCHAGKENQDVHKKEEI